MKAYFIHSKTELSTVVPQIVDTIT